MEERGLVAPRVLLSCHLTLSSPFPFLSLVEEKRAATPNGTGFVINLSPSGQGGRLEATNLAVGELVGGADVAARLSELKAAQPTADSPYFKLAKKLGDRRADVAEKYFLRPFQKVVVTASGVL